MFDCMVYYIINIIIFFNQEIRGTWDIFISKKYCNYLE